MEMRSTVLLKMIGRGRIHDPLDQFGLVEIVSLDVRSRVRRRATHLSPPAYAAT